MMEISEKQLQAMIKIIKAFSNLHEINYLNYIQMKSQFIKLYKKDMRQPWKKENNLMKILVRIKYKQKIKIVHNMKILLRRPTEIKQFEGQNYLNILLSFYMLDNQIYIAKPYNETRIKFLRYC